MAEEPRHFKQFQEIKHSPPFDPETPITLESLIGEYHFSEEVIGQVRKVDGNRGHKHRHDWLGKLGMAKSFDMWRLIVPKNTNADQNFARERTRVRSELNIRNYIERLSALLNGRDAFLVRVDREAVLACPTVPEYMTQTGNRAVKI